jgi:hypothetical protein
MNILHNILQMVTHIFLLYGTHYSLFLESVPYLYSSISTKRKLQRESIVLEHFIRLSEMSFGTEAYLEKIQVVLHKMYYLHVLTCA